MPSSGSISHPHELRVQALALLGAGHKPGEVYEITGIHPSSLSRLQKKAKHRGYAPEESKKIKGEFVSDAPRSGRPSKINSGVETNIDKYFSKDRAHREKTAAAIGYDFKLSPTTIRRILKKLGYRACKSTKKPILDKKMMEARLEFCKAHAHWTLEQWKDIIWTDETSVVLGSPRGRVRTWRKANEALAPTVIRRRWKKASEFMFWGCFSYDKKGPCYIWNAETAKERKAADKKLDELNKALEPEAEKEWELETGMHRIGLRNKRGKKPQWRFTKATGKVVRGGKKGGIDWYRYHNNVVKPLLLPFAKECQKDRPNTQVMEDNAPAHASRHQRLVYSLAKVLRLLWPGNSPDLNAIEPCWPWMKRKTTRFGAPRTRTEMVKAWEKCWYKQLTQDRIQKWIERIPRHIQEVIRLNGGNEYREGREGGAIRPYDPAERRRQYRKAKEQDWADSEVENIA